MSKFSVITSIVNMEKLNNEILMYKVEYKTDPYLFMSKGTFYALSEDFSNSTGEKLSDWSNGYFAKYNGYKIFRNDDLKYGEIELR